jgi:hypothetical protein
MNIPQWMTRFAVLLVLNITSVCVASAQGPDRIAAEEKHETRVAKVFINITGDPKLAHRLWTFIDLELEDSGILVTNTEADADTIINGTVSAKTEPKNLTLGVVRMQLTVHNKAEKMDSCATLSTEEKGELFDLSYDNVADELRQKYPDARTVMIDPASDMKASPLFREKLPAQLKTSGFAVANAKPADLVLRIELVREKVAIEEDIETFEISVVSRNRQVQFSESGSGVLSSRLTGHAPEVCPDRLTDLEWLSRDGLFRTSQSIAKHFRRQNAKVPSSPSGMNKN